MSDETSPTRAPAALELSVSVLNELSQQAADIRLRSYSPYSKFSVGAALLGKSGQVYLGTNVENVSYGLSICAEVSALTRAIAEGERDFQAIAIVGGEQPAGLAPCGRCRQMLAEFSPKGDLWVMMLNSKLEGQGTTLATLLPLSFNATALESEK